MVAASRRRLWTGAALVAVVAAVIAYVVSADPGAAPAGDDAVEPGGSGPGAGADTAGRAAGSGPPPGDSRRAPAAEDGLADVDLGEDSELSGDFEPPSERQVHRWELFRDGRRVGSFRAEVGRGQEGMIELRFHVQSGAGTDRGSVTTVSRLFYRYARLAVEAESASRLPLLTVLAPPALEAVLATMGAGPGQGDETAAGEAEAREGEPVTVAGTSGRRFSASVGDGARIETVVVPGRLLPLQVRTTLPDGTLLEARPPGGSRPAP